MVLKRILRLYGDRLYGDRLKGVELYNLFPPRTH
jgi:hypothetical protein